MNHARSGSRYMHYLPSVFQQVAEDGDDPLISRYLRIFEKMLSGIDDGEIEGKKGILETLDIISDIFHPGFPFLFDAAGDTFLSPLSSDEKTAFNKYFRQDVGADEFMDEFLRWMAGWTALVLKEDWELETKREVIARILPIYRMRGTKTGLEEYLKIYVGKRVTIVDEVAPFQVGIASHVGKNSRIGGFPPYFFIVNVDVTYLFDWDRVPGSDSDVFINCLRDDYGICWADGADVHKSEDGKTIHIEGYENSAGIVLDESKKSAILTIDDGTAHKLDVKRHGGKLTVHSIKKIHVSDIRAWKDKKRAIEEIIDSEKPVHTDYWLKMTQPLMTVGVNSNVGENTLL